MTTIPLVTSIPPKMRRQHHDGRDFGEEYGRLCIESWRRSGFSPFSVNSRREVDASINNAEAQGIRYRTVERDALGITGKPLVFLGDLLRIAAEIAEGPVVITNADILLELPQQMYSLMQRLGPGTCIVAKRYDIDDVRSRKGVEYVHGYDFFAFHSSDLGKYTDSEFIFGAPWWDHYLPLMLAARGIQIMSPSEPFAFHLVHDERWRQDLWTQYGCTFINNMKLDLGDDECSRSSIANYLKRFNQATEPVPTSMNQESTVHQLLCRVADTNVRYLDEVRTQNPLK